MTTIEKGQKITARSVCDHNCIFSANVLDRKGNFLTIQIGKDIIRKKVKTDMDGNEYVMALGSYSMAPMFK